MPMLADCWVVIRAQLYCYYSFNEQIWLNRPATACKF